MARGTFANIRIVNKFMSKAGPKTLHLPSGKSCHGNLHSSYPPKFENVMYCIVQVTLWTCMMQQSVTVVRGGP